MENQAFESPPSRERSTVVYTCSPWGGVVCGVSLVLIGGALILSEYFPTSPEIVWGVVLIIAGVFSIAWASRHGDWL